MVLAMSEGLGVVAVLSSGLVGVAWAWVVGVVSTSRDRAALSSLEREDAQPATATIRLAVAIATAVERGVNLLLMMNSPGLMKRFTLPSPGSAARPTPPG